MDELEEFRKGCLLLKEGIAQLSKIHSLRADPLDGSGTFFRTYNIGSWIQIPLLAVLPGLDKAGFAAFSLCCKGGGGDGGDWLGAGPQLVTWKLGWAPRGYK